MDSGKGLHPLQFAIAVTAIAAVCLFSLLPLSSEQTASGAPQIGQEPGSPSMAPRQQGVERHGVTLITGDKVDVEIATGGKRSYAIVPANPHKLDQSFQTINRNGPTYVIPDGIDLEKTDIEFFNIDYLVDEGYDKLTSLPAMLTSQQNLSSADVNSFEGRLKALDKEAKPFKGIPAASLHLSYANIAASYRSLMDQPEIKKVWLNKKLHVSLADSVPLVAAPTWWDAGFRGEGMKIAILDTGIDSTHPALDDLDDNPATNDPKVLVNVNLTDDPDAKDRYGHGTHCAGISAGTAASTNLTGIAPGAWLWNVKILNQYGSGYSDWIIDGINYASLGPDGLPRTGDEADVISMSLGGAGTDGSDPISQAVNLAVERGVTVVISAGNSGPAFSSLGAPGVAASAITVGATDKSDAIASFSSRGPTIDMRVKPDVVAPGVSITSAKLGGGYVSMSGTSMAAPHVAGAAALLLQYYGDNTSPQIIKDALMYSAKDLGYAVYEQGAGRLDLSRYNWPKVGFSPASLSLGQFNAEPSTTGTVTFFNSDNASHLVSLSAKLTDAYTGGNFSGSVSLAPGSFTVPASGQVSVNVTASLSALPSSFFSGTVTATVDGMNSVHAVFGFAKLKRITVQKTSIAGGAAAGQTVWLLMASPSQQVSGYRTTDASGTAVFYAPAGVYNLLSYSSGGPSESVPVWTVAENITVSDDTAVTLDERLTMTVDFNPNRPGLRPAAKASRLYYAAQGSSYGFGSTWWYPQSFVTRVSATSHLDAGFVYQAYPEADFKPGDPGLVNTGEWFNLVYSTHGVADNLTFVANVFSSAQRHTIYGVAIKGEKANWSQGAADSVSWWPPTVTYQMDAPSTRWEWLSPSPAQYYASFRRAADDQDNLWSFSGWQNARSGSSTYSIGTQPLASGVDVWVDWATEPDRLSVRGSISRDLAGNLFENRATAVSGNLTILKNDVVVLQTEIDDQFNAGIDFTGTANFTVEAWGRTPLDLSRGSYTRFDFNATQGLDSRPPQVNAVVPGINPFGVVSSSNVSVQVSAKDDSQLQAVGLRYALGGSTNWTDAGDPAIQEGLYVFNLGELPETYVSIEMRADDQRGNSVLRTIDRAFYAAPGPGVSTDGATAITTSSARLNGTLVSREGASSANVSFEYGTVPGHLTEETQVQELSTALPADFHIYLAGLSGNTRYYYRAKAVAGGVGYGAEKSFTTLGGSISGHVFQSDNATPIPGASVYATPTDGSEGGWSSTSADGSYTISHLQGGSYRVSAQASGYVTEYYDGEYSYEAASPVTVTSENDTPNINISLDVGGSISGHVFQADNTTAISGAFVSAYLPGGSGNGSANSNADGSYTISGLLSGNYTVYAQASTYVMEYYIGVYSSGQATPVSVTMPGNTPDIDFSLDVGGSISGHVLSDNGTPISGAYISADSIDGSGRSSATAAADGTYTVRGLFSGNYRVYVQATNHVTEYYNGVHSSTQATPVSVTMPDNTPGIDFRLDIGGSISGHVFKSDNQTPISGASVYASRIDGEGGGPATTNADGSYVIRGLPSGSYRVSAQATNYVTEYYNGVYSSSQATSVAVTMPNDTPNINLSLDIGGTISGHVFKSDNQTPILAASVYASMIDGDGGGSASTAADGSYTIRGLPSGSYRVSTQATNYVTEYYNGVYSSSQATPVAVTMPNDAPDINFSLDIGGTISGHVFKSDNQTPISGAWVSASSMNGSGSSGARTAVDGSYTIRGLFSGTFTVAAQASGYITEYFDGVYLPAQATPVAVSTPDNTPNIDFSLDAGGSISGRVLRSANASPISGAAVFCAGRPDGPYKNIVYTAANGTYTISGLPTGMYTVFASAAGYVQEFFNGVHSPDEATPVTVTAPDTTPDVDFTLDLGGSISGHVYRSDNTTPISGAFVNASRVEGTYENGGTISAPDGSYTISGLLSGNYTVYAQVSGCVTEYYDGVYSSSQATPVAVTMPNDTPNINFSLDAGGTMSGRVFKSDNVTPISGARVRANSAGGAGGGSASTDADGSYSITGLSSGNYTVSAEAVGYITEYYDGVYFLGQATPVSVTVPTDTPNINFSLDVGATISGHVYQSDNTTPISGAFVFAGSASGLFGGPAATAADGSYTITGLATDNYTVSARATGYVLEYYNGVYSYSQATPVWVTPPEDTPGIDFSLDVGGTVSGHVYRSDNVTPVFGAIVRVLPKGTPPPPPGSPYSIGTAATTAADGRYSITGIPPGEYVVRAEATGYINEFYLNTYRVVDAAVLAISLDTQHSNIDFSLDRTASISGHVYRNDGTTPIAGVLVRAASLTGTPGRTAVTSADGAYAVTGLMPGNYRLSAGSSGYATEYYSNASSPAQATPVTGTSGVNTTGVDFSLETRSSSFSMTYLGMNTVAPQLAFQYPKVRLAAYLALDRGLFETVAAGEVVRSIVSPNVANPNIDLNRNVDEARKLLLGSGYPIGFKTELTTYDSWADLASAVAQSLGDVGIYCSIRIVSDRDALFSELASGRVELYLAETAVDAADPADTLGRLLRTGAYENFSGYSNSEFDTYADNASYEAAEDLAFPPANDSAGFAIAPLLWHPTTPPPPDNTPPAAITDLAPGAEGSHYVTLTWTAPGDDGTQGAASQYDVRYLAGLTISETNWASAMQASGEPTPKTAGSAESFVVSGISGSGTHSFAVKAADNAGNWSAISNVIVRSVIDGQAGFPPGGGGIGPGGGPALPGYTSLAPYTNGDGLFNLNATVSCANGNAWVTIDKGTVAKDTAGTPLKQLAIFELTDTAPAPPSDTRLVSLVYDFLPEGAAFTPSVLVTVKFNPATLPQGVRPPDLYIARWDGSNWLAIESTVDVNTATVSARSGGFSKYAILGKVSAAIPTTTSQPGPTSPTTPTLPPASFSLSGMSVSPATLTTGQTVTISAKVSNTGGTDGEYEVTLRINGAVESSKRVSVSPGSSATVAFTVKKMTAGIYQVDMNGAAGSFRVETSPTTASSQTRGPEERAIQGTNWLIVGIAAAAFIVVAGLIGFIVMRTRKPGQT